MQIEKADRTRVSSGFIDEKFQFCSQKFFGEFEIRMNPKNCENEIEIFLHPTKLAFDLRFQFTLSLPA